MNLPAFLLPCHAVTIRECLALDAAEVATLDRLAGEARPATCPACNLIQFIERADGVCNHCHEGMQSDDVFAELTETERAQIEAFNRRELAAAKREAGPAYGWLREQFQESGKDITDFTYDESPESADFVAGICGYTQPTWGDGRNVSRREKEGYRKVKEAGKAHQLKCAVAAKKDAAPAKVEAPKIAPVPTDFSAAARFMLKQAVENGVVSASKAARLLAYYAGIFEGREAAQIKHAGNVPQCLELLQRSLQAKATR